jgi:hypothetical protein
MLKNLLYASGILGATYGTMTVLSRREEEIQFVESQSSYMGNIYRDTDGRSFRSCFSLWGGSCKSNGISDQIQLGKTYRVTLTHAFPLSWLRPNIVYVQEIASCAPNRLDCSYLIDDAIQKFGSSDMT